MPKQFDKSKEKPIGTLIREHLRDTARKNAGLPPVQDTTMKQTPPAFTPHANSLTPMMIEAERVLTLAIEHWKLKVDPKTLVLTIQTRGKRNALGWFAAGRWQDNKKKPLHEINLSAENLRSHDMGEVLIHELAHAENQALGIRDVSSGQLHNKKFKEMAERMGLVCQSRNKKVGYGFTELGPEAKDFLDKIEFKREVFTSLRVPAAPKGKGPGSRLIKCECKNPDCGYTVRTTDKWITKLGAPLCPCNAEAMNVED